MRQTIIIFAISMFFPFGIITAQVQPQKGRYQIPEEGFYQKEIKPSFEKTEKTPLQKRFTADINGLKHLPESQEDFMFYWHNPPESQGNTGTCWAYAATSFLESEIFRLTQKQVRLSEMYFVYMDYVERAKAFVRKRGDVYFEHGSEANAVTRMLKMHGALPFDAYPGKAANQRFHTHDAMMKEMKSFLQNVKHQNLWNETLVVETIKDIMNHYMGTPPKVVEVEGAAFSPESYRDEYLQIRADDFFSFMSTKSQNFNEMAALVEPDNWWGGDNYYNLPLNDYAGLIDDAVRNGFTVCICGDLTEPGHNSRKGISVVPSFDIPAAFINQDAREYRLDNHATTDDHCMHLVGVTDVGTETWYLIKDSGAGGFDGPDKGYRFFHEDYVRLKMMNVMIHKNAAKKVLDDIIK
jgi:bleomycin hydrolase